MPHISRLNDIMKSGKLSHSGFNVSELYTELESALCSKNLERAVCLTAELACTTGGQTRSVVSFLIDTYCSRCVNSGRSQLNLLRGSLAHLGDGTTRSPDSKAGLDIVFRRGLCSLTLLVACASHGGRDTGSEFARVPLYQEHLPSLESTLKALRIATAERDAHTISSIIKSVQEQVWFSPNKLRASVRSHAVWNLWNLACELGKGVGVSEYVDNCLHAFSWGYSPLTSKTRLHLLWYAFLVIVKGAPRSGPHPIEQETFDRALLSIDNVFEEVLCKGQKKDLQVELDVRLGYLATITRHDPGKAEEVEKDRENARGCTSPLETKSVDIMRRRVTPA